MRSRGEGAAATVVPAALAGKPGLGGSAALTRLRSLGTDSGTGGAWLHRDGFLGAGSAEHAA
jgi:hypothetical protein